jgi:hypothetical protein
MTEPFIYFATHTLKPGKLEQVREFCRTHASFVEEKEPQLLAFHLYLDEANERLSIVQIHPDSESMATHMAVIAEHLADAWDWLGETQVEQALGTPPPVLTRFAQEYNEPLEVFGYYGGGFTR